MTNPDQQGSSYLASARTFPLEILCPSVILTTFFVFLCCWNKSYFTSSYIPGCDLPGQVAVVELVMAQLPHWHFSFYDPGWFCGWAVDLFYAPLSHVMTAILAYPLAAVSIEPALLACHLSLVFGSAALPFSMWFFILPFAKSISQKGKLTVAESGVLALSIGFLSFWFLNHDSPCFGIGFASVMGLGLYAQLWGWHLLFLHAGALVRLIETGDRKAEIFTIVFFTLLFLSHSLTAIFALGIVIFLCLWYPQFAFRLLRVHVIAIALSAFWSLPALALSRTYAVVSTVKGFGDFLELIFRYPLALLIRHIQSCLAGHFVPLDLGTLLVSFLFLALIPLKPMRRSQTAIAFFVINLIAVMFTSSPFLAKCFYATIHYYRFFGDELLFITALLALVPLGLMQSFFGKKYQPLGTICLVMLLLAATYSTASFPMPERQKIVALVGQLPPYQDKVLQYFKNLPEKGRVYFEYFEDESKYGYFSWHCLESRLFKETGFESVNGLFVEGVNSYRLPATAAGNLGAHSWSTALILTAERGKSDEQAIRQLKEFGITHIVCGAGSDLFHHLKDKCVSAIVMEGPYAICQIAPLPSVKVKTVNDSKRLIGYIDKAGNLPFEEFQYYLFSRDDLSSNLDVIDLTNCERIPKVPVIIVNTGDDDSAIQFPRSLDANLLASIKFLRLNFSRHDTIDHYHVWYQDNPEFDSYNAVSNYLTKINFPDKIQALNAFVMRNERMPAVATSLPKLKWSPDFQSMTLRDLQPGIFVKVNYSYLPFWHSAASSSSSCSQVFKGTNEQIYVLPDAPEIKISYDEWVSPYFWQGLSISAMALLSLFVDCPAAAVNMWKRLTKAAH